ncbi:TonB-dependent receptor [Flavobacterium sp. ASW18X]|uniref:TonB-dependent receptor n=1 Tax=Flavobacterium sp. ASW18X TaxID=2572595 RepID=UPI0010AEA86B|nr:TonB-dependent receptor [Flavobacterium sp. ASW18X]TKD62566.1 TonB-dependent receptor [Flavobacterium sp. ASW18X]
MKNYLALLLFFISFALLAQTTITGTVTAGKLPVAGANVYLEGTYDGASTDAAGRFSFITTETGTQTLVVSSIGYDTHYEMGEVTYFQELNIVLQEAINSLSGVTLTAGSFEAGTESKAAALKPLDIVTTAGVAGDIGSALQTLPGTTTVSEDGRLFVRGGRAEETQVFIDGQRVFQPFMASTNNVPTRGRFSPFLFKGVSFSTGGYSAEYGQALSGVLLMNTTDLPDQEKTDISVMSVGAGLGHTEIWGNTSLSFNTSYINLSPYEALIPSTNGVRWNNPYESMAGEAVFRHKGERSMFKFYTGFNHANFDIDQEDINFEEYVNFRLKNNNLYLNANYKYFFENNWTVYAGASTAWDTNAITVVENDIETADTSLHLKLKASKEFSSRFKLNVGSEVFHTNYEEEFMASNEFDFTAGFDELLWSGFAEADVFFSNNFALKLGARAEYSNLIEAWNLAPRASLAYKTGQDSQLSLAYGNYYQNPLTQFINYDATLDYERTAHYILNYQYAKNGKTFRVEGYYKDYDNLVKYDTREPQFTSNFTNLGNGYAAGLDVFYRDNKSIKNLDYWLSYSYLNTERDFLDFTEQATPNFANAHNFSAVGKYWVNDWRSQIGMSYSYGSGRPYDNPNTPEFYAEKTKDYHNLSLNWAYLIDQQKILFFSVNNVLGTNNIGNYQYANTPNAEGVYNRRAISPAADSFFFVGFFWTISSDKKSNQLDNL